MNCKDISRCLDEIDLERLPGAATPDFEAHLAGCRHCAGEWRVTRRLLAFRSAVPPVPAPLRDLAGQLEQSHESNGSRGASRRPVIIGSLLLFGVAASALLVSPFGSERAELAE